MWDALNLAMNAHQGQVDKLGVPYIKHVVEVARGVTSFGEDAIITALLHDVVEDTYVGLGDLAEAGAPPHIQRAVFLLTKPKGGSLEGYLKALTDDHLATLVKISDNAHNSLPERAAAIQDDATRERLARKYALGREILWKAVPASEIRQIIRVVNPTLESLLEA
jgi:(p)ppGpp synthase/HD superfamily hydrolase